MKVLVTGVGDSGAVSRIVRQALHYRTFNNLEIVCLAIGDKNKEETIDNVKYITKRVNPFLSLFLKIKRKIFKAFKKNTFHIFWKNAFKQVLVVCNSFQPDLIIAASGHFYYMKASYEVAKRKGLKLELAFFDPFNGNALIPEIKKANQEASKWCAYASRILYDADGDIPLKTLDKNKVFPFLIPIFVSNESTKGEDLIYGGYFYEQFRPVSVLTDYINTFVDNAQRVNVYSDKKSCSLLMRDVEKTKSITVHPMMSANCFDSICNNCLAIIVIGNANQYNTRPSKILEAIGHRKPIIILNFGQNLDYVKKYPFLFDANNEKSIESIKSVDQTTLMSYDVYSDFPDRHPNEFLNILFGN